MSREKLTARKLIEDHDVSFWGTLDFVIPYQWLWGFGRTMFGMCNLGHGFIMSLIGHVVKAFLFFLFLAPVYIAMNLFYNFSLFWFSSCVRLFQGIGNEHGPDAPKFNYLNIWFFTFYTFLFCTVYMYWFIPWFIGKISWTQIGVFLGFL